MRPASRISIAALCAPSRTGATRTGSGAHPRKRGPYYSTLRRIPAPPYSGCTSLRFAPRLRPQRQLFSFLSARLIIQQLSAVNNEALH